MTVVGHVESLWRYPVKSMGGEELREAFLGFAGVYGDRVYAVRYAAASKGFPFLTARQREEMLQYQPRYRNGEQLSRPPNLLEAEALGPGVTPVYPDGDDLMVDVKTPTGEVLAIDDPRLSEMLADGVCSARELSILRSDRAMTDCRPVSLFSLQTVRQLGSEVGAELGKRRFRANVYVQLDSDTPFGEDELVGRTVRIGSKAVVAVTERDPRCKMITLDPDTSQANPEVMKMLSRDHESKAGVYGAVLVEGMIRQGDAITVVN